MSRPQVFVTVESHQKSEQHVLSGKEDVDVQSTGSEIYKVDDKKVESD